MTINVFSALNLGIGLALCLLAIMAVYHVRQGYTFAKRQQRTALYLLAWGLGGLGVNLVASGLLGTVQVFAQITQELPRLAGIVLVAKLIGGLGLWALIRWIVFDFYPTQRR